MTGAARRQSSTEQIDTTNTINTIITEKSKNSSHSHSHSHSNKEIEIINDNYNENENDKISSSENNDFSSENSDDNSTEINDFEFVQNTVCDISSENYGKNYNKQFSNLNLHNESSKSICSAFPITPTYFTSTSRNRNTYTKQCKSPSILSDESSLLSSQLSYADDRNKIQKNKKISRKKKSYYNLKKKNFKNSLNCKIDDEDNVDDDNDDDMNNHRKEERNERKERRASIVSKEEEVKI